MIIPLTNLENYGIIFIENKERGKNMKTKITIELTIQEKDALFNSSWLVKEICGAFSDCSDCPLHDICKKIEDSTEYDDITEIFDEVYCTFKD